MISSATVASPCPQCRLLREPRAVLRTAAKRARLPILLIVNVPLDLLRSLIDLEAAPRQDLDDAGRLGEGDLSGLLVLLGNADHLRVAAQKDVRVGRIERDAEAALQVAAG